jgi:predicted RND superfamily exporter protein
MDATPHDWSKVAAEHDCVVVVNDAGYDLDLIRQHAPRLVDARDHRFDPVRDNRAAKIAGSPAAVYTGIVPIVYKAQRSLLQSLISSSLWSFLTITPLMMLVSRSFTGGMVAMLPNVLPVVMVFGGMGWLGIDVDVGSMMTASIALGVAVDDTIHYLNWFREELDRTGDRKTAILAAYKHCATPTFQAAIISGIGLSVFALSTFTPTQRFGILMLTILWMGVIAELIFFPAILAGPLGSVFKPRKKPQVTPVDREPVTPIVEPEPIAEELAIESAQGIPAPHEVGVGTPSEHRLRLLREDGVHGS